jgi:hypothetical protein
MSDEIREIHLRCSPNVHGETTRDGEAMSDNGARLELVIGHMADVPAEMRALVNELHAHEKNVRLRSELEYLKERVWHLCDEHAAALVAHVKLETTAGRRPQIRIRA